MARTPGSVADDTRQRILEVAVDLFIEQGYAGTSVRDISERLGMTKGSLYYHFASKEDVLTALVVPLMDDIDAFIVDAQAAPRVEREHIERLVTILDAHGVVLRSLMGDPSVLHGLAVRLAMPQRLAALQRVVSGGTDEAATLRGRCALGVVNAGTVAPRFDLVGEDGTFARGPAVRARLTEAEKTWLVDAAMAVLAI